MKASIITATIADELKDTLSIVDNKRADEMAERIVKANRIFLAGAGRSLLMIKCCAMRLIQFGLTAYVVGETTTPSIDEGDLLLVASGSGETGSVAMMAKKAKKLGAQVGLITISPESTIGQIADTVVKIDASSTKVNDGKDHKPTIQLGGSMFELSTLLLLEAIVMMVVERLEIEDPNAFLMKNHANLE